MMLSVAHEVGYTVTAGSFIVGETYLITSVGTTNFQAIGATSNTIGIDLSYWGWLWNWHSKIIKNSTNQISRNYFC